MSSLYNSDLKKEFFNILKNKRLTTVFQPIINVNQQKIFGYEGLIRGPSDSILQSPERLFEYAEQYDCQVELDNLCYSTLIQQFCQMELPEKLFINITPATLLYTWLSEQSPLKCIDKLCIDPKRIVIEITECQPVQNITAFQKALRYFREAGFEIAIDDLGTGYSGLQLWSELRPDYVKIDRYFVNSIQDDKAKRKFIRSIYEIAYSLGCQVIAEGVETQEEYSSIRKIGGELIQGYYFCRPLALPPLEISASLFRTYNRTESINTSLVARDLLKKIPKVSPLTKVSEVADIFTRLPSVQSIAIVDNNNLPQGIITRGNLTDILSRQFGRSLYSRKPISLLYNENILIIDAELPLETLSQRLTSVIDTYIDEFFIVEEGKFLGKGNLLDVLKKITDLRVETARYANPLTMLPGNVPIQKHLEQCLAGKMDFVIVYCDLDHFKPYNDYYGYGRGDEALKTLSQILITNIPSDIGFIGHIGGDDFILFIRSPDWQAVCKKIILDFKNSLKSMYNTEDYNKGYIKAIDRMGKIQKFALMTLSMGAIIINGQHQYTADEIAQISSKAKSAAKKQTGNSISYARTKGESEVIFNHALINV